MNPISRTFAAYALTASDFPHAATLAAKTFMLDSLGVGIAGAKAPFSDAIFKTIQGWGSGGDVPIWGRGVTSTAASAAFMNGFQIHSMEYDCVHEPAVVHPMATIFAALSAEASAKNLSGQALLEAVIVAVDVAIELGVAAKTGLKFFRPATAGLFGAALGIARLRGFDEDTALSAMGCALAQCAGVMQAHVEGKPTLPAQIAGAARSAVVACDLAENGLAGPVASLEGPFGYFAMFEDEADAEGAAERLGTVHRITEVSWKPFPTGRAAQGGIVLVQKLREQGLRADNLVSLTLSAPPIIPRLVNRPMTEGMTPNYARLCFPYLAPIVLLRGTVGLGDFTPDDLSSRAIFDLSQKIRIEINDIKDPAEFVPQSASAILDDGRILNARIETLFGSPDDPLTRAQHLEKFRGCLAFGFSGTSSRDLADRLIDRVEAIEEDESCREIFRLASEGIRT